MFRKSAASVLALAGALAAADDAQLLASRIASGECADSSVVRNSWFDISFQAESLPTSYVTQAGAEAESLSSSGSDWSVVRMLIDYGSNFKLATDHISKEVYVLTQCGTGSAPTDAEVSAVRAMPAGYARKDFTIPVQSVIATGTTQLPFFEALGLKDRVTFITEYAVGACWQKGRNSCSAALEGAYGNATLRANQMATADMVLLNCNTAWDGPNYCNSYASNSNCACTIVNDMPNGVHFASTTAVAGNLHTAEFIKWLALFFNKEREAEAYFASAASSYTAAAAAAGNGAKKKVAWVTYYAGSQWGAANWRLSAAVYKAELVTAAGGEIVDGDAIMAQIENMTKTVDWAGNPTWKITADAEWTPEAVAAGYLMDALKSAGVDILVDETYAPSPASYTITDFLSGFHLTSTDMQVLRVDGTINEAGNLDWFESRIANPHQAVRGLQRLTLPDASLPKFYFRDISANEAPDTILASECSETLPFCDSSVSPSPIGLLVVDAASAARGSAAVGPLAAALALAAAVVAVAA